MRLQIAPLALAMLLGLASLNGWLLVILMGSPPPEPAPKVSLGTSNLAPASTISQMNAPKPKPIGAYGEILAKPAFFKTRAPYVPPPPPPPPPPPKVVPPPPQAPVDPGLTLAGVVMMEETRKAYILNTDDSRGTWLREGESIQGWKVEAIGSTAVRLHQAGRSIELELYPKKR